MRPSGSSRWCPTPDQVMILEEMYKAGVRTPSASQIQKITAHLNLYGKIEGKNVFYWFQNHKARDRQKLRKKLTKQILFQQQHHQFVPVSTFLHGGYLDFFMSPSVSSIPPLANYYSNAPNYLRPANTCNIIPPDQGGDLMMVHKWKISDTMNYKEFMNPTMKMYSRGGCDEHWMNNNEDGKSIVEEEETDSPAKPVETLQLFPTTCTNLKQQSQPDFLTS